MAAITICSDFEKKCKKAKWLSEEALQIAVKRREVKSKGEKDRYSNLNAEFQRIARRDKKAFLSDQCKEIEESCLRYYQSKSEASQTEKGKYMISLLCDMAAITICSDFGAPKNKV